MKIESLANTIETNIARTFKKFIEKPAIFLSKSDATCYMYYLLVTDPFLGHSPTILNLAPNVPKSKTFLVHAGLEVQIQGKNKQVALSIGEAQKETELSTWDFPVGIEIERNLTGSPAEEAILSDDIEKIAVFKRGYLLCLNWETPLTDETIAKVKKLIAEHDNVRFFFVDLAAKPIKTNFKKI